jgi:NADPH-dependent glutamate synthase beta subunit-like oxidoreductase
MIELPVLQDVRPHTSVNADWLDANFPCRAACPVHTEAGKYVAAIAEGRFKEAYQIARATNPFASICGRICAAPCEDVCRRGELDAPVSIRALKRFVCEQYGVESLMDLGVIRGLIGERAPRNGRKVAIVGSGPAGMSAAHDLALMGYDVTVFEARDVPGGMLRLGVPEYRLPRELVRMEINFILSLGVELRLNQRLGEHFTLKSLTDAGYEAVFLAIGAQRSQNLNIEGRDLDGVVNAIDFLLNVNLGYRVEPGRQVVVIGGGNVAFDAARTALRHAMIPDEVAASDLRGAMDVARSAIRFGAAEVTLVCLEPRDEMLADEEEIGEGLREGIHLFPARGPSRILGENGRVAGVETIAVRSIFDAQGRFNPTYIPETERVFDADTVIIAIGQRPDVSCLEGDVAPETSPRGTLVVHPDTLATSVPGVFAGGDAAFGPRIAVMAVADGLRAARSMDAYLGGGRDERKQPTIRVIAPNQYRMPPGYDQIPRQSVPVRPLARRVGIAEVELGYSAEQAVREAQRCLHCWVNPVYEGNEALGTLCILCRACVDVCPEDCLDILPLPDLVASAETWPDALHAAGSAVAAGTGGTVFLKNETICIRCGLCAQRCPVGCISMQSYGYEGARA